MFAIEKWRLAPLLAILSVVIVGCSTDDLNSGVFEASDAAYATNEQRVDELLNASQNAGVEPQFAYESSLSLSTAIERALRYSPALRAAAFEIQAKHGEAAQAAVRPNPEASLDVENFAGTGALGGFASAEETLAISQRIELGDKRLKRLAAANLDTAVTAWNYEAERLAVIRKTAEAFIDILAIQQTIAQSMEANRIASALLRDVKARVDAGGVSPIEIQRTKPIVANTLVRLDVERARLGPAKRRLASMWGASRAGFGKVAGRFSAKARVPSADRILADLAQNPQLARWSDEIARRDAVVTLESAKAIPDVTLGAGIRRLNETDDTAVVANLAVSLPVFDRNAGNIAAAEARLAKAEHERGASEVSLRSAVLRAYGELAAAAAEVRALAAGVVPPARAAYRAVQASYQAGEADLLIVLDARRVLFDAKLNLIDAQAKFEKAKVRIEGIIGRRL